VYAGLFNAPTASRIIMDEQEKKPPYDTSQLEKLGEYKAPKTSQNNAPNKNLMLVKKAQGSISQVWDTLCEIEPKTYEQKAALDKTKEDTNLLQATSLYDLQKAFE